MLAVTNQGCLFIQPDASSTKTARSDSDSETMSNGCDPQKPIRVDSDRDWTSECALSLLASGGTLDETRNHPLCRNAGRSPSAVGSGSEMSKGQERGVPKR